MYDSDDEEDDQEDALPEALQALIDDIRSESKRYNNAYIPPTEGQHRIYQKLILSETNLQKRFLQLVQSYAYFDDFHGLSKKFITDQFNSMAAYFSTPQGGDADSAIEAYMKSYSILQDRNIIVKLSDLIQENPYHLSAAARLRGAIFTIAKDPDNIQRKQKSYWKPVIDAYMQQIDLEDQSIHGIEFMSMNILENRDVLPIRAVSYFYHKALSSINHFFLQDKSEVLSDTEEDAISNILSDIVGCYSNSKIISTEHHHIGLRLVETISKIHSRYMKGHVHHDGGRSLRDLTTSILKNLCDEDQFHIRDVLKAYNSFEKQIALLNLKNSNEFKVRQKEHLLITQRLDADLIEQRLLSYAWALSEYESDYKFSDNNIIAMEKNEMLLAIDDLFTNASRAILETSSVDKKKIAEELSAAFLENNHDSIKKLIEEQSCICAIEFDSQIQWLNKVESDYGSSSIVQEWVIAKRSQITSCMSVSDSAFDSVLSPRDAFYRDTCQVIQQKKQWFAVHVEKYKGFLKASKTYKCFIEDTEFLMPKEPTRFTNIRRYGTKAILYDDLDYGLN